VGAVSTEDIVVGQHLIGEHPARVELRGALPIAPRADVLSAVAFLDRPQLTAQVPTLGPLAAGSHRRP
jgi:hypothetical protein